MIVLVDGEFLCLRFEHDGGLFFATRVGGGLEMGIDVDYVGTHL